MTNFLEHLKANTEKAKSKQVDLLGVPIFFRELSHDQITKFRRGKTDELSTLKMVLDGLYEAKKGDDGSVLVDADGVAEITDRLAFTSEKEKKYFISHPDHLNHGWRNRIVADYSDWLVSINPTVEVDVLSSYDGKDEEILSLGKQLNSLLNAKADDGEEEGND